MPATARVFPLQMRVPPEQTAGWQGLQFQSGASTINLDRYRLLSMSASLVADVAMAARTLFSGSVGQFCRYCRMVYSLQRIFH